MAWLIPVRSPLLGEYHIDVLSSGYLDVSVLRVCFYNPMYSGYKYLFQQVINCRAIYNQLSGGLPHSEIHGSKLILSSPWLIAEYHVFHRLLLPRHSPNALIALDLIQKKQDLRPARIWKLVSTISFIPNQKSYNFSRLITCRCDQTIEQSLRIIRVQFRAEIEPGLVYLTWTTPSFQPGYIKKVEEAALQNAFHRGGTELRLPRTCDNQQCCLFVSL